MTSSDSNPTPNPDEIANANKILVINTITEKLKCAVTSSSKDQHEIFIKIHNAINEGNKLDATILSGGITNYSYKVFINDICLFAKLSFEYALWNPGTHHDLKRTTNEYDIMKIMNEKSPNCVVTPLACWDLYHNNQKSKLLITEWSKSDEQFGNQFVDGCVDPRIASQLADTLASLHKIANYDPNFNETVKPCMINLLQFVKQTVGNIASDSTHKPKDRTETYFKEELGYDILNHTLQSNIDNFNQRDCLIHSDSHVFNILVEPKPSVDKLEDFGPNGSVVLCDWEMAMVGPIGRDIGLSIAGPIGCLIGHMLNGGIRETSIELYINTLLDRYLEQMSTNSDDDKDMSQNIYRNIIGWCGWCQFVVFYFLGVQMDAFGVETEELQKYHRDTMGILGLKLMHMSFYDDTTTDATKTLEEWKMCFMNLIEEEILGAKTNYDSRQQKQQKQVLQPSRSTRRKSSILRESNRRLSDASIYSLHNIDLSSSSREFSLSN